MVTESGTTPDNGPKLIDNQSSSERLLTKRELADELRCHIRTVRRRAKAGMPTVPNGGKPLFLLSECLAWLRKHYGATEHGKKVSG